MSGGGRAGSGSLAAAAGQACALFYGMQQAPNRGVNGPQPSAVHRCQRRPPWRLTSPRAGTVCVPTCHLHAGRIAEDYPWLSETGVLDVVLPKKQDLVLVKL